MAAQTSTVVQIEFISQDQVGSDVRRLSAITATSADTDAVSLACMHHDP